MKKYRTEQQSAKDATRRAKVVKPEKYRDIDRDIANMAISHGIVAHLCEIDRDIDKLARSHVNVARSARLNT